MYLRSARLGIALNLLGVPLFFAYFVCFEAEYGQTVGKMVTGVVVVTDGGGRIGHCASTIRSLLRIVDLFPYPPHLVRLAAILLTDRNQRLGDLAAEPSSSRPEGRTRSYRLTGSLSTRTRSD